MKEKTLTMKDLPVSEMPYEKCMRYGAGALSDAELLAVIIKTGTKSKTSLELAIDVLKMKPSYQGLAGLHHLSFRELLKIKGIGQVKAVQILCVAELSKRLAREAKNSKVPRFEGPQEIADYFMEEMRNLETEHLYAVFMDASCRLLYYQMVFKGTIQSSTAHPRELLRMALQHDAAQYVIMHNHPSGDPTPSPEDIHITGRLQEASSLIGIPLVDHIIIGDNQFVSLKERGCL